VAASNTYKFRPPVLLQKSIRLLFRVIRVVAVSKFALGCMPKFILAAFGPAGNFPQLMGAGANLLNGRTCHFSFPYRFGPTTTSVCLTSSFGGNFLSKAVDKTDSLTIC
jgi:hypothetical protein